MDCIIMNEWAANTYNSSVFGRFYKLRDWIDEYKLNNIGLSHNPAAVPYLEQHPEMINWFYLCSNPAAMHLIEANPDKIRPSYLSPNPAAMDIIEANPNEIVWPRLCKNPAPRAIKLLKKRAETYLLQYSFMCVNTNPEAIRMLAEETPDKIYWPFLCTNPAAMHLIKANPDKIDFNYLCENPAAMHLIKANLDKINWARLSYNPAPEAIELLSANPDKISYIGLSFNPAIFTYDYARMRATRSALHADLAAWFWSPARVAAFLDAADGDIERLDEM